MIEVKNTLDGELNASIIKEYPELENITITPTQEEQKLKSEKYGFGDVTVKAIDSDEIVIIPSKEEQVKEGLFNKVSVGAIKTEEITVTPSKEEQIEEGLFDKVTVKAIETQDLVVTPTEEEQKFNGLFENVTVEASSGGSTSGDFFTPLDYIESTGTQYIDTGIIPTNHKLEIRFQYTEANNDTALFGEDSFRYHMTWYNNRWHYYCGGTTEYNVSTTTCTSLQTIIFNNDNNKITFNGGEYGNTNNGTSTADTNLYLFCRRWGGKDNRHSSARIYFCKIYEKTTNKLVRYFIPAKNNETREIGFLDLIEQKFYGNAGTGKFISSGEIDLEDIPYLTDGLVNYFDFNGRLKENIVPNSTTNQGLTFEKDSELNKFVCKSNNGYGTFNTQNLPKTNFTLSILAKSDGTNTEENHMLFGYVDKTEGGQLNSLALKVSNGYLCTEYSYGSTSTNFNVNDNKWHRYTVTVENSNIIKIYVDDQLVAEDTQTLNISSNAFGFIGSWYPNYQFFFNGWLSDALIYDRVLTVEGITNNYNQSNLS